MQNGKDEKISVSQQVAAQLKRQQNAIAILQAQRDRANNEAAETRLDLMAAQDEISALRSRVAELEKETAVVQEDLPLEAAQPSVN